MSTYPARRRRRAPACILGIAILAVALMPLACAPVKAPESEPIAAAPAPTVQEPAPLLPMIKNIAVDPAAQGKGWLINISPVSEARYTVVKITQPLSLVVYLPLMGLGDIQKDISIDNDLLTDISSEQKGEPQSPSSWLHIGLKKDVEYQAEMDGTTLKISMTPSPEPVQETTLATAPPLAPMVMTSAEKITDIRFEAEEKTSKVQIVADGAVEKWKSFTLKNPMRLVVDIGNVQKTVRKSVVRGKEMPFTRLRMAQRKKDVRVVLDFPKETIPPYHIQSQGNMLLIVLGEAGPKEPAPAVTVPAAPPAKAETEKPQPPMTPMGRVKSINFKEIDHQTRIMVGLTEKSPFSLDKVSEDTLVLSIQRCRIPSYLQRFIDTTYRYTSVARIIPEADKQDQRNTRIVIKLKNMAPYSTLREGNDIYVDIEKPAEMPPPVELVPSPGVLPKEEKPAEAPSPPAPPEAAAEKQPPAGLPPSPPPEAAAVQQPPAAPAPMAPGAPMAPSEVPEQPQEAAPQPVEAPEEIIPGLVAPVPRIYTGRRITLDFQDADINHLFRLIADVSSLNIIAGDNVKGKVTVRLIDVPWDQALDVILETNKLGKERIGNVIRIAPMAEIQAVREERLRQLKKQQDLITEMQEKKAKAEPLVTRLVPVNFATAKTMVDQIKGLLSERGNVRTDDRTNTLVITDTERNVDGAVAMVKKLDTPTPQVLIEARVVEANTDFTRELGIQWGGRFSSSPGTGNAFNGNNVVIGGTTAGGVGPSGSNWIVNLPAATGLGSGGALGLTLGSILNTLLLDIQLSALESTGAGRIVSNPKVTTLDNKQALINQGSRIPYPRQTQDGISTDFIDATLNMTVTPHITFDGSILMKIEVKQDRPDFSRLVLGVPAVNTRRATTEVLVNNGETTVIGGIVTSEDTAAMSGVPWFNRLPGLGNLFRTRRNVRTDTELLIFITPRIVTPNQATGVVPWMEEKKG